MNETRVSGRGMPFPAWLLRSKVAPTRQRVDLLERPLLTARLHRALDAMLSVIHAPAGYGKSTLLASWRQQLLAEGHTVCWLSLGRQENDPIQLLTYVAFALSAGGVRFDVSSGELSEREFLSVIIHAAAEHDRRIVLVLDDFENLEAPAVDGVVQPLIGHAPANLHIAIATRDASRLRIANLEARGQAVSFGVAQLRFTAAELDAFLSDALGAARLRQLYAMTEGWPVAVQMIRSAVRNAEDADRILRDLTGDAGQMAAYLSEEVLGRLEPGLQEFLMDIALVDRIDCALANHLRECDDGHARFAQARALDALVLPLDSMESTYRLHPLFREHLYERLQATRRDRGRALHLRAAQWFSERGDLVEAVRHCVHAGAESHAGDIVHGAGGVMLWFREGLARLRAIMALLSETTVLADWRLALIRCLLFVKDGEVHRARLLYDAITARCDVRSDDLGTPVAGSSVHEFAVMAIVISLYEGNPISQAHCRELEARIDALEEGEHAVRGHLLTFLCISYLQRGEFRDARRAGERAIPAFMAFGSLYGTAYIYFHLGDVSFAEGNPAEAARCYQHGLDIARQHFADDQGMQLVASILMTELNYELGTADPAPLVARSIPQSLQKHEAWFDIYAAGYTTAAHMEFDDHGIEGALAIVDGAVDHAERNRLFRLTQLLASLRMELLLRAGRVPEARIVMQRSGIDITEYRTAAQRHIAWRERDAAAAAVARLLIAEGRHREALPLLAHFSDQARESGDIRARMRFHLLLAIAHDHDDSRADRDLELDAALAQFAVSRYLRPFLDLRHELQPMLEQYCEMAQGLADSGNTDLAQAILRRFGARTGRCDPASLLSPREREVLRELVHGHSNKGIARRIDVSESTVRFHLRNVFTKLSVNSRLQAVAVARQQSLV